MNESLRRLLNGAFDFAGLSAPRELPLDRAADQFARFRAGAESNLLGRFVCPIDKLEQLIPLLRADESAILAHGAWPICARGTSLDTFREDLGRIEDFEKSAEPLAEVQAYEVKLNTSGLVPAGVKHLLNAGFDDAFVEVAWSDDLLDTLQEIALTEALGVNARLGGADASWVPSVEEAAAFLRDCVSLDIPFKLSGGLHHAVRQFDPQLGVPVHGFLNVLIAAALSSVHDLTRAEMERILLEESLDGFWFSEKGLGWTDFEASLSDIDDFRHVFQSIEMCSIDEPVASIRELRLATPQTPA